MYERLTAASDGMAMISFAGLSKSVKGKIPRNRFPDQGEDFYIEIIPHIR